MARIPAVHVVCFYSTQTDLCFFDKVSNVGSKETLISQCCRKSGTSKYLGNQ